MGVLNQSTFRQQKQDIICCPLCGHQFPNSSLKPVHSCPVCDFDLTLLMSPEQTPIRKTIPENVPKTAFVLLVIQGLLSAILAWNFFFIANPNFFGLAQMITGVHLASLGLVGIFGVLLHRKRSILIVRIGLMAIGFISLPVGIFAFATVLLVMPSRRWCFICGKQIRWSAYLDCPHCNVSMHRWGSCRKRRFQKVAVSLDNESLMPQIEYTCPHCLQSMFSQEVGEETSD